MPGSSEPGTCRFHAAARQISSPRIRLGQMPPPLRVTDEKMISTRPAHLAQRHRPDGHEVRARDRLPTTADVVIEARSIGARPDAGARSTLRRASGRNRRRRRASADRARGERDHRRHRRDDQGTPVSRPARGMGIRNHGCLSTDIDTARNHGSSGALASPPPSLMEEPDGDLEKRAPRPLEYRDFEYRAMVNMSESDISHRSVAA